MRTADPRCNHCEELEDSAVEHTLFDFLNFLSMFTEDVPDITLGPEQEILSDDT